METENVRAWLQELGLSQYAEVFTENAIDQRVLADLTEADLEKLGVLMGHRKILLKAIAAIEPEAGAPTVTTVPSSAEAERRNLTICSAISRARRRSPNLWIRKIFAK